MRLDLAAQVCTLVVNAIGWYWVLSNSVSKALEMDASGRPDTKFFQLPQCSMPRGVCETPKARYEALQRREWSTAACMQWWRSVSIEFKPQIHIQWLKRTRLPQLTWQLGSWHTTERCHFQWKKIRCAYQEGPAYHRFDALYYPYIRYYYACTCTYTVHTVNTVVELNVKGKYI